MGKGHQKLMHAKNKALATVHKGNKIATEIYGKDAILFDYGNLSKLPRFKVRTQK